MELTNLLKVLQSLHRVIGNAKDCLKLDQINYTSIENLICCTETHRNNLIEILERDMRLGHNLYMDHRERKKYESILEIFYKSKY